MKTREMKQFGWLTGPVECRCTCCDWAADFIAVDSSIPVAITNKFATHKCADYAPPFRPTTNQAELGNA